MIKVFLIHGAYGNPQNNWFSWLRQQLEELGYEVIAPKFPTPQNQTLENWNKVFLQYENQIDSDTIFIGHSLACVFLLNVIEKIKVSIKCAFLVAGFLETLGNEKFDIINQTFVERKLDFNKIKHNCNKFIVYHSDNDPYVPIKYANDLAEKLGVDLKLIKGAGHFNIKSGYDKFEELLKDIKKIT